MRILSLILIVVSLTFGTLACESKDKKEEESEKGEGEGNEASGEESGGEDPGDEEAAGEGGEEAAGEEAAGEGGEEPSAEGGEDAANAVGPEDSPNEGDSCEGLVSSADALMVCNGQKLMFCSSYSKYKWQMTQECPEGKTCTVSEDMNQGSCK